MSSSRVSEIFTDARLQRQRHGDGDDRVHLDRRAEVPPTAIRRTSICSADAEDLAEDDADIMDGLRGTPEREPTIRFRLADRALRLHLHVVNLRRLEVTFDDHFRFGERLLDVPLVDRPLRR